MQFHFAAAALGRRKNSTERTNWTRRRTRVLREVKFVRSIKHVLKKFVVWRISTFGFSDCLFRFFICFMRSVHFAAAPDCYCLYSAAATVFLYKGFTVCFGFCLCTVVTDCDMPRKAFIAGWMIGACAYNAMHALCRFTWFWNAHCIHLCKFNCKSGIEISAK